MTTFSLRWAVLPMLPLLAGCAHAPADAGFSGVQDAAALVTDAQLVWNRNSDADATIAARVHDLLGGPLDADSASAIALLNNRGLQATYEDLGIARADLIQAGLLTNPSFSVRPRWTINGPGGVNTEFNVGFSLLDVFPLPLRTKVARVQLDQAVARVSQEVLDLDARTRDAVLDLQAAEAELDARRSIVDLANAFDELADAQRDAGNLGDLDYLELRLESIGPRKELAAAEARVASQREQLNRLLGLWGDQIGWTLAPLRDVPASTELPLAGLEKLAIQHRQDLVAAHRAVELAAQAAGLDNVWVKMAIDPGLNIETEINGPTYIGPSLDLQLPLFDQGQGLRARNAATLRQAVNRLAGMAVDVRSEVREAYDRLMRAHDLAIWMTTVVAPLQAKHVVAAQREYNVMVLGVQSLLQSRREQMEAGIDLARSRADYWKARGALVHALGCRIPGDTAPN
ncbi:MAG: TolC family protein [Planctomycetota bacterium]